MRLRVVGKGIVNKLGAFVIGSGLVCVLAESIPWGMWRPDFYPISKKTSWELLEGNILATQGARIVKCMEGLEDGCTSIPPQDCSS